MIEIAIIGAGALVILYALDSFFHFGILDKLVDKLDNKKEAIK